MEKQLTTCNNPASIHSPAIKTPFKWLFAGGPMVANFYMLTGKEHLYTIMSCDMWFPTMLHFGKCRLRRSYRIFKRLAKALTRLRVCTGWSEALLVAHTTLLEFSCHGSMMWYWLHALTTMWGRRFDVNHGRRYLSCDRERLKNYMWIENTCPAVSHNPRLTGFPSTIIFAQ